MENEVSVQQSIKCDKQGCNTACCKRCACCVRKSQVLKDKEEKINELNIKILELMARPTSFTSDEQLRKEKEELNIKNQDLEISLIEANQTITRLRQERNDYYQQGKKLHEENKELKKDNKKLQEITDSLLKLLDSLRLKTTNQKEQIKKLTDKTSEIIRQIEVFPKK